MKAKDFEKYTQDILNDLATLVSYPSVYNPNQAPTPFGFDNRDCLHKALEMAEAYGFRTCNVDDYCGYIEMGQGEEIIGVLAHLDVVPVSDSWNTDPFKLTEIDGKLYGRGTADDKGAAVAALTAMRELKALEPTLTKRVRLILGCNEETGSRGIAYYVKKLGYVDCGFTPDGANPVVFGEKGGVRGALELTSEKISDIKAGTVGNVVAAKCTITFNNPDFDVNKLDEYFMANNIKYTLNENVLEVIGTAAHASTPELGVNAISHALEALYLAGLNDELTDLYHKYISTTYNGEKLGIDLADEYGRLTFNNGVAFKKDGKFYFTIDIRYPVSLKKEDVIKPMLENGEGHLVDVGGGDSLFFPPNSPMIEALMKAYQEVTGDSDAKPLTMGGGTYAKEMKGIVAIGGSDDKHNYHIHDDNEFITMESLLSQCAIYYEAIKNLDKMGK